MSAMLKVRISGRKRSDSSTRQSLSTELGDWGTRLHRDPDWGSGVGAGWWRVVWTSGLEGGARLQTLFVWRWGWVRWICLLRSGGSFYFITRSVWFRNRFENWKKLRENKNLESDTAYALKCYLLLCRDISLVHKSENVGVLASGNDTEQQTQKRW